jgi:methionine transaminase
MKLIAPTLTSKLPQVGTTIFTVMSALAQEHKAVNLGQGFPDFACDPRLLAAVNQAMLAGHNQYPPMPGTVRLRQAIAAKVAALYGQPYDWANEVTVTAGATQAILTAILAVVHAGDEVLVMEPSYDSYVPNIVLAGGIPVLVPMAADFSIDWDRVKASITPRSRLIIVNSPHNPSGRILSQADMLRLQALAEDHNLFLISDEVYEHMVFDGNQHHSASSYPGLARRSFVISSFGKTYHVTGWKIAYCLAPAALTAEFRKVHQYAVFSVNTPMQEGLASFMEHADAYLGLSNFYQAKRDSLRTSLARTGLKILPCEGTYFQLASFSTVAPRSDLQLSASDLESELNFSRWMTRSLGVTVIPVSAFYQHSKEQQLVRLCFAKKESTLSDAAQRLAALTT